MPKVTETVEIAAAPAKVFEFISDPKRASTFVPGLNRISNVSSSDAKVGRTWEYEFNWHGLILDGKSECTKLDPPKLYEFRTISGAKSTWTYRCEARDGRTRLTLEVEFELPQGLVSRFATGGALEKMNRNRAHETLANVEALLEP
jgi:uncharacterized protein YndB with AHSA1/START domain